MPDRINQFMETGGMAAGAIFWAFLGRLLYVFNLIRIGRRSGFWTLQTLWELVVAIGMGVVCGGLAEWLGLAGLPYAGFISAGAYLGPHIIELGLAWLSTKAGIDQTTTSPVVAAASTNPEQSFNCTGDCHDCPLGPGCPDYRGKAS